LFQIFEAFSECPNFIVVVIVAVDPTDDVINCIEHGHNKGQKGQLRISNPFKLDL